MDCPAYATYLEAVLADDRGAPSSQPNAICLFERAASDIAWRHFEMVHGQTESRHGRELVVRYIAAIGNYDYIFDWVFRQDGGIKVALGTSGMYPNQSHGGDGLPRWTQADRAVEDTDIVLWYTLNLHHVVRAEDWPVMPTVWHGFELRPFDFFARNPALDLPK